MLLTAGLQAEPQRPTAGERRVELEGSRSRGAAGRAEAGVMDAGEGEVAGQARA